MWIYDGEQWIEEGASDESNAKPDTTMPQFDQFVPELQVIEIPLPRPTYVPPFPLP
jgi:hypothetical protein